MPGSILNSRLLGSTKCCTVLLKIPNEVQVRQVMPIGEI